MVVELLILESVLSLPGGGGTSIPEALPLFDGSSTSCCVIHSLTLWLYGIQSLPGWFTQWAWSDVQPQLLAASTQIMVLNTPAVRSLLHG